MPPSSSLRMRIYSSKCRVSVVSQSIFPLLCVLIWKLFWKTCFILLVTKILNLNYQNCKYNCKYDLKKESLKYFIPLRISGNLKEEGKKSSSVPFLLIERDIFSWYLNLPLGSKSKGLFPTRFPVWLFVFITLQG